jgi:hypothetical protein
MRITCWSCAIGGFVGLWALVSTPARGADVAAEKQPTPVLKQEHFDKDPGWEGLNNRLVPDPKDIPAIQQNFGYSPTSFAGGDAGEIGGTIWRSVTPAFYAERISPKTLNEKLTSSGKFTITKIASNAGIWFGWFDATAQQSGNARPTSAMGLNLDFQGDGARLSVRATNEKRQGAGSFVTPYLPGEFRTAPLCRDIHYSWTLTYDPQGAGGNGRIEFMLKSLNTNAQQDARKKELAEGWASLKSERSRNKLATGHYGAPDFDGKLITIDLPAGFKSSGTKFDHFGLINCMKEGSAADLYFDDVEHDGKKYDFAADPNWDGQNNHARIADTMRTGYHDFGFSEATNLAGGAPGELGGIFWRPAKAYGYYADRIGPLSLDDPLEAHGKLMLKFGTPDGEMCFGWFNSSQKDRIPIRTRKNELGAIRRDPRDTHLGKSDNFLGIYLTKDGKGCALHPALVTAQGEKKIHSSLAPHPDPGQSYDWTLKYDPRAADGQGAITITLADQTATLVIDPKLREQGATFDRFGVFASGGGGMVHIFFDDLEYTAQRR